MENSDSEVPFAIAPSNVSTGNRHQPHLFERAAPRSTHQPCCGGSASDHEDVRVPTLEDLRRQWPSVVDLAVHANPGETAWFF